MLTGTYSIVELTRIAENELHLTTLVTGRRGGTPLAYSSMYAMFRNVFYTGKLSYLGEIYQANHKPMVTEEEFYKVQQLIDPKHATRPKQPEKKFLLRHLFKCDECGFSITAERKYKLIKSTGEL